MSHGVNEDVKQNITWRTIPAFVLAAGLVEHLSSNKNIANNVDI